VSDEQEWKRLQATSFSQSAASNRTTVAVLHRRVGFSGCLLLVLALFCLSFFFKGKN